MEHTNRLAAKRKPLHALAAHTPTRVLTERMLCTATAIPPYLGRAAVRSRRNFRQCVSMRRR
jgi:hypothetical protein